MLIPSVTCCKPVILLYTVYTIEALAAEIVSWNEKTDDDYELHLLRRKGQTSYFHADSRFIKASGD